MSTFFSSLRILIVDDEQFIRQLTARLVHDMGVEEVLTARDGGEALRLMSSRATHIDLIILDIEMPNMNGLDLLKKIRAGEMHADPKLPVIMLTGHTEEDTVKSAIDLGVQGFLKKPMSGDSLRKRIKSALSVKR